MGIQLQFIFQLTLASILGGMVGLEREFQEKEAGLRTYALVALGAALFALVSFNIVPRSVSLMSSMAVSFDPSRIASAVVVGVGFIGAGVIIFRGSHVSGVTTAAGLWLSAAIGVAVAAEFYISAIFVAVFAIIILRLLALLEARILRTKDSHPAIKP